MKQTWLAYSADGEKQLEGFTAWQPAYRHWELGDPVGWAVLCYRRSKQYRRVRARQLLKEREQAGVSSVQVP